MKVEFSVVGIPAAQGSKRHVGNGRMIETSQHLLPWRSTIAANAALAGVGKNFVGPVTLDAVFKFPRPKYHFGTGKNLGVLKPNAPILHATKPDLDKLLRALLDGITASGLWQDDCQVVAISAKKIYADMTPGVTVEITDVQ